MLYQIRSWRDNSILYEQDCDSMKECVRRAIREKKNLSWSDLSWSDLSWSDLSWSDLSWSNFSGSDLSGSNLPWSNLSGSNLSGSKGIDLYSSCHSSSHPIWTTSFDSIHIGCEHHKTEVWLRDYEKIGARNGYTPAQIEEYGLHIRHIAAIQEHHRKLKADKKEEAK